RVKKTAMILWSVYLILTFAEIILLRIGGMNLFESAIHTFGTVATGGFSSMNASIGAYPSMFIQYVIIAFMFLAGINFILYCRFLLGERKAIIRNKEAKVYATIILVMTIILTLNLWWQKIYPNLEEAFRTAFFHITSIVTTTGYVTADFDAWPNMAKMLIFVAMFIGGCAGSTGSSIKVIRVYVLVKSAFIELFRSIHPSAVKNIYIEKEAIPQDTIRKIIGFFVVYLMIFFSGSLIMSFFNLDFISAITATAATLGNVGPGLGMVGATEPYTFLPSLAKLILCFFMLLGRLEIFTLFIIFTPAFWKS
ncbi:MAG: TrkH family potassium uptake protein, partial [Nanoarchaeota archaeon]|nr:TrkH family potassium uptake protein [Nanoarchaeota archaeon]